jgi:hypothetical protein
VTRTPPSTVDSFASVAGLNARLRSEWPDIGRCADGVIAMSEVPAHDPFDVPACPECESRLFVGGHTGDDAWICHSCEVSWA